MIESNQDVAGTRGPPWTALWPNVRKVQHQTVHAYAPHADEVSKSRKLEYFLLVSSNCAKPPVTCFPVTSDAWVGSFQATRGCESNS